MLGSNACGLCHGLAAEYLLWEDGDYAILRTKRLKGHRERVMIAAKKHVAKLSQEEERLMLQHIIGQGRLIFKGYKFIVMSPKFGTIQDHAHLVASDISRRARDFDQMLGTPWLHVEHLRDWDSPAILISGNVIL